MFFTLTNVLKKKKKESAQEKCMQNYEFWLNKLAKKKSQEHNKCHDIFSITMGESTFSIILFC